MPYLCTSKNKNSILTIKYNNIMKKSIILLLALVLTICLPLHLQANNDQVITFDRLPATAQTMLKQNFSDKVPLVITADRDDYKVMYQSGEKVEFDKKGNWRDIECKTSQVPAELIPAQIAANVNATFPGAKITKIERDRRGYSIKLSNGLELEYNQNFQVIEVDD